MRSVLTLCLLIGLCAAANATTVHHSRPRAICATVNTFPSPAASPFLVGPTKKPGSGCIMAARPLAWVDTRPLRSRLTK